MGFSGGSEGNESACNSGDLGSIPGLGGSPGGGHGNPLQYSYLENPHGHKESDMTEQLSTAQHSIQRYSTFLKGHISHCIHVLTRSYQPSGPHS